MKFAEFQAKSFPEKSVFDRPQFDFLTNFVKWFAIRVAYVFFKLGISSNLLDVLGLFFTMAGFILISTAIQGNSLLPLVGIGMVYLHVFLDFVDGPVAKGRGVCTPLGHMLDEIGGYVDRFTLFILFGLFTESVPIILMNVFAAGVFQLLIFQVKDELPKVGILSFLRKVYLQKYSFLSIRFTLLLLPFLLGLSIMGAWNLKMFCFVLSIFYAIVAAIWLVACIPNYGLTPKK